MAMLDALISKVDGGKALRARPGARKGHQQGRHIALQILARAADQVGSRNRLHALAEHP